MVLDSLFNKEIRLLKKVEKLHAKGENIANRDPGQAHELLIEALNTVESNKDIIKDKKADFSNVLANVGNLLCELSDYKNGDAALKRAIEYNPKNAWAYIFYARSLNKRENYDLAQSTIEKAIVIDRKNKEAWETKAEIYENKGDIDEALKIYLTLINLYPEELKYYDKYLHHKPNDEKILIKKGILLYKKGNYDETAKVMNTVIDISPHNKQALLYLGAAYEKLEKYEDAISAFKKVIQIDREDKHGWVNLAVIYKRRAEYDEALIAVNEGIKIDPNDPKIWQLKSEIEYDMERYVNALESVEQAISLNKKNTKALALKREILKKEYSAEEMAKTCYELINLGKRDIEIYYDLAEAYYKMENMENALEVIDTILSNSPNHLPTLILKENVLINMNYCEKAIETGETIIEIDPKNVETLVNISKCYERIGKNESALHAIKRATDIDSKNVELLKIQKELAKKLNKPTEIITACVGITSIVEDFDSYFDLAKAYYSLGRFGEAKDVMDKALRIKEDADAWNLYGMINYKLSNFENAKKAFERATELAPKTKKYWSNLGWILEKLEKYNEAISCFDKALELDPEDMRIWYEKGVCLERDDEWEAALKCFDEALKLNPKFSKALMEKGEVLIHLEHLDEALNTYSKVLKIEPTNHLALYKRAYIMFQRGKLEACEKDIDDALKYKKEEQYLELKKDCCKALKNWDCVVNVARSILKINGRNMNTYRDLAQAYMNLEKVDSAIATYNRALQVFPDNETFLYEIKDIFKRESRYADLVDTAKRILAMNPDDFVTLLDIGWAYMEMEKYDDAEDYLQRALNIKKTKEVYNLLGELYMRKEAYKNAVKYFADSLKIEEDPEINYKLAKAEYKLGDLDLALSAVRKAIQGTKEVDYYLLGAKIYQELEDSKNAIKYGEEALNIEDSPRVRLILGKILIDAGENTEAITILKNPAKEGNIEALKLLGLALEREDRLEEAVKIYENLLKYKGDCLDAYLGLGRVHTALQNYKDAKEAYEKAYKLDPENPNICESISFLSEKLGDLDEARKYVDIGLELDSKNKHLWTTKGRIMLTLDKYEEAKRAYEEALSIDAEFQPALEGLRDAERKLEEEEIEKYARKIIEEEHRTGKKVSKKIAFKKLDIPLSILPKVFKYIKEEVPLSVSELEEEDKSKYEKATLALAKKLNNIEKLKLSDIIANTSMKINSAKRLLKYIEYCINAELDENVSEDDERLVKKALDMDIKNISLLNLMLNLEVGICRARKIQKIMKEFLEEEEEEEGSVVEDNENIEEVEHEPTTKSAPKTTVKNEHKKNTANKENREEEAEEDEGLYL